MKITMVVVLYKQKLDESKTFQSLEKHLFTNNMDCSELELIIYDNSPEKQNLVPSLSRGIHISYIHDPRNLGIATAYNSAWSRAKENGSQWLLLLDHDTELTDKYIQQILDIPAFPKEVAAVVPKIISENVMISPVFSHTLRPLAEKRPEAGIQNEPVMAINSGALVSVDFLNSIGGFNESFPLDYLDHWLFYKIYEQGFKVWLWEISLNHELSVMDYSRVSLKRYQSILESEINFYKNFKKDLYPFYRKQLVKRLIKQVLLVKNKKIALYTLRRLFSV
ncbi:glycosyltransferase [Neobacillus dielmonensis]|uniref:glycosyltransferase n=1 Tax=Neobacillus dielmonensis TaxID=1347369 RepID=UPI0005A862BD|nr:glycosyltransferase [Neobacillus dielmonensis]